MAHDLVIRGGNIIDGTGAPGFTGDIAVKDGIIVAVGDVVGKGRQEMEASGLAVTPGFVDGHTHMDAQVFWDPMGTSSCWHGVTTVVMGNCGFTLAPSPPGGRDLILKNIERAEDISAAAMDAGIDWSWSTFREYLDAVDAVPKGINYSAHVGHSALRIWAMGERAFEGEATEPDLRTMTMELRDALDAGAMGFTTSRSDAHETPDDVPVASRFASWAEVSHLVNVVGEHGPRVVEWALEVASKSDDPVVRRELWDRMLDLAVESRTRFAFGVPGPNGDEILELCEQGVALGADMYGLSHSRGISCLLSFNTALPFDGLPSWQDIRSRPHSEQKVLLRDPAVVDRLVSAVKTEQYARSIGASPRAADFSRIYVFDSPYPPYRTVADVAASRRLDPVELMIQLGLETEFEQFFLQPLTNDEPDYVLRLMRHPRAVMTFSDSGAHVSQIVDCSIQTHLLSHWVRRQRAFTLEEGVRMITSAPSQLWGFADRGVLRPGMVADLNLFDAATIGPAMPALARDLPAGVQRLTQRATGIRATIVAGDVIIEDGEVTGAMPGRLLRAGA
jgi:N-acyl-D-amino-acid deacylase